MMVQYHASFLTHERGGSLDSILSDFLETNIQCKQLDQVHSSYQCAILGNIKLNIEKESAVPWTIWLWERADWPAMKNAMDNTDWETFLVGYTDDKARYFTNKLLAL